MKKSLSFSYQVAIVLVMVVIGAISGLYLPWYTLGILFALLAYILRIPTGRAFALGLVSGFLLWAVSAFWIDGQHPSSLPERMAHLFPLGGSVVGLLHRYRCFRRIDRRFLGLGWCEFKIQ